MKKSKKTILIVAIILAAAIVIFTCVSLWLNAVWFNELGYLQVFTEILGSKIGLWCGFFVLFFQVSMIL